MTDKGAPDLTEILERAGNEQIDVDDEAVFSQSVTYSERYS